jgi:hypothetical protein
LKSLSSSCSEDLIELMRLKTESVKVLDWLHMSRAGPLPKDETAHALTGAWHEGDPADLPPLAEFLPTEDL